MAAGEGTGRTWLYVLSVGAAVVIGVMVLEGAGVSLGWAGPAVLGVAGLAVVFGACEAMIRSVEGLARRLDMNEFVAGTMAGLASNIPEVVMLAFVLVAAPRVGFIVTALSVHVGVATFGIYSALLPRDKQGNAAMPAPLVSLSTDLYAAAAGAFFTMGAIMALMHIFDAGDHHGEALGATDLYVIGAILLSVEVVAVWRLIVRFRGSDEKAPSTEAAERRGEREPEPPSVALIAFYGLLGIGASLLGGHAVGDFADALVDSLAAAGYPEMLSALILSVFASSGAFVMMGVAHAKGKYDIALANCSGQITQVPFLVMPIAFILLAAFAQTGVIPPTPNGGVLPIDLETTTALFLGFPSMLILWKSVQDDGQVNWLETASMVGVFGLTIYLIVVHG